MKKFVYLALSIIAFMAVSTQTSYAVNDKDNTKDSKRSNSFGLIEMPDGFCDVGGHIYEGYNSSGASFQISFKKSGVAYLKTTMGELFPETHKGALVKWTYEGNGVIKLDIENRMPMYLQLERNGQKLTLYESYSPMTLKFIK